MRIIGKNHRHDRRLFAAASAVALLAAPLVSPLWAGTNEVLNGDGSVNYGEDTISISGSTALKNFITSQGFTDLLPNTSITVYMVQNNTAGPIVISAGANATELAPSTFSTVNTSTSYNALRVEYHESGSVEGILELANDQIYDVNGTGTLAYVSQNIDRNPNNGNAVWVNGHQIGGVSPPGGYTLSQTAPGNAPASNYLGPFYGTNAGGTITTFNQGTAAVFNQSAIATGSAVPAGTAWQVGQNVSSVSAPWTQAGQNAVQLAISDVVPQQAFANDYSSPSTAAAEPWFSTPQNYGYGFGRSSTLTLSQSAVLPAGGLGTAGGGVLLQSSSVLNMPAAAINPRTGSAFGAGPWNTGGLTNLNSQATAVSATLFVANPGTGLDRVDQTDAQWLDTTGRLANGATFDMTTRDVNSGTRNVSSLDVGIDPSFSTGVNDSGNGNATDGATSQISIGAATLTLGPTPINIGTIRYSNKTAGGAQLRPTVQDARMAVGTLSVGDANGNFVTGNSYPIRALDYSQSTTGAAPYVQVSASAIVNGLYTLYQNEQFVTLKSPDAGDANFANMTTDSWANVTTGGTVAVDPSMGAAGMVPIQGDDPTGTVSQLINNVQESEALGVTTINAPAFTYFSKGFILPEDMNTEKLEDGGPSSTAYLVNQNVSDISLFLQNSLTQYTTSSDPDSVTTNNSSGDKYDGKGTNVGSMNGVIPITSNGYTGSISVSGNSTSVSINNGNGGNWLFGNFNQDGIRDFDSVIVTGEQALAALEASGAGNDSFTGSTNNTSISGLPGSLGALYTNTSGMGPATVGATKGDLIAMGDYDGRGVFDGQSLYELAVGASLTDTAIPTGATIVPGVNDTLTLQSETLTVWTVNTRTGSTGNGQTIAPTTVNTETLGDALRRGVLNKNAALDYLNGVATTQMKEEAAAVLSVPGTSANVPFGATDLGGAVDAGSGVQTEYFTYDPHGTNAYNPSDVNRDGVVDFNDAVIVDASYGKSYSNLTNVLTSTYQAPVTGTPTALNLVLAQQIDGEASIGAADLAVENTAALSSTNTGNANWYGYDLKKTGPGTIVWGKTAGTVTVYSGAQLELANGNVDVGGTLDPFSDNNAAGPGSTAGNHVGVIVDSGSTLAFTNVGSSNTVSSLVVNSGGVVDIGKNKLVIDYGASADPAAAIDADLKSGAAFRASGNSYNSWNGTGIVSSAIAPVASSNMYNVGYLDGNNAADNRYGDVAPNQILVEYTVQGNAFLESSVGNRDLQVVAADYGTGSGEDWSQGSFDYSGSVGNIDLQAVAAHYGSLSPENFGSAPSNVLQLAWDSADQSSPQVFGQPSVVGVPEPGSLALAAAGAGALLARRRRRSAR